MAEVLAGLLTSAIVGIAKEKLGSAIGEQANLLWNFDDDLEYMKDKLETISAALKDAERRSVEEEFVRLLLKRLKHAALDISDMLEDYQDAGDKASAKTPGVLSCLPMAHKKIAMANRMKSIRKKLENISEDFKHSDFKVDINTTTAEQHYDERETASGLPEKPIIERHTEMQEIINLLSTSTNNKAVIVPIYGLGGMGKTTLAQLVYNNRQFKEYDHRIWVYVSQDFNLNKIGRSIVSQLQTEGGQQNLGTRQEIHNCLGKLLPGKKVLVVLDDLWEDNNTELEKLRGLFAVKDSMIDVIVTTRSEDIAKTVCTSERPYKLQPLKDDICWEVIKRSSRFEYKSNQEKLEQIGLDLAKKCKGVALAAQALGFMLKSIDDPAGWANINNNDIWKEPSKDNNVLPSLKLSYEAMPQQLRICFSYCAIFPKGHTIVEDDLVHQWIALDFIEQSKGKEYIKKLLEMSFLQVSKSPSISRKQEVRYTMHDLVHDLARLTMADELIVSDAAPHRDTRDQKYCRYSLLRKYDQTAKLANILPSKIRALRFSESETLDMPSGAFSFAKCLRTLDFSECSNILLPASIGKLKQLRCLIAPRMLNEHLPKFTTELPKLHFLSIDESKVSALSESIGKLVCLKYLDFSRCHGISKLPKSFGDLKCLVHLDMSCCNITELPDSLANLTNLQHLDLGFLKIKAIPDSLCGLTQLQYLNLSFCDLLVRLPEAIGSLINIKYLNMSMCSEIRKLPESMKKLHNLVHLVLSCCHFQKESLVEVLRNLTALQHLDMSHCAFADGGIPENEVLDVLSNLTNLKYLILRSTLLHYTYGLGEQPRYALDFIGSLTNLEHLDLSYQGQVEYHLPESIGDLKKLHTLNVSYCDGLKSLPKRICELGLKCLKLNGCSDALLGQASSLLPYSSLATLPCFKVRPAADVNGCSNLHILEGVNNVSELKIYSLENVRSSEEANKIKLLDKHNLLKLTLHWNCDADRLLVDRDLLGHLVPPRGLKQMSLNGYSSTSFPGWFVDISHHLTNLVSISLEHLHQCGSLPPLGQLPHLEALRLFDLPRITKIDRELCGGKGAFRRLARFSIENMDGLEEWNTTYSGEDGVEEFMFPVLHTLEIENCPVLRFKPCAPQFRMGQIIDSNEAISSLEELSNICQYFSSSRRGTELERMELCHESLHLRSSISGSESTRMEIFHHFPALQRLCISHPDLTSLPESMQHLTCLQRLELVRCDSISALPEWLGDLSSLEVLFIVGCEGLKSLPSCIQQLTKLQRLGVRCNEKLKEWCGSEENKTKLAHVENVKYYGC